MSESILTKNFRRFLPVLLLLACMAAAAGARLRHLPVYDATPVHSFQGHRLLTAVDGYLYLRFTQEYLEGRYEAEDDLRPGRRPMPAPLLVRMTAGASRITGLHPADIAFFLPVLLSSLAVPLVWLMALRLFRGSPGSRNGAAFLAALAASLSPMWYIRTQLGWFDTDSLNLVLTWWLFLAVHGFTAGEKPGRRVLWLAGWLIGAVLLRLWWPQAGTGLAGISLGVYALTVILPSSRGERIIKGAMLAGGAVFAVCAVTGWHGWMPGPFGQIAASLGDHLRFSFEEGSTGLFPAMGRTVAELNPLPLASSLAHTGGHWIAAVVAGIGLIGLFLLWRREVVTFGIPVLVFVVLSFGAQRFLMFLAPAFGLGAAAAVIGLWWPVRNTRRPLPALGAVLLAAVLLAPAAHDTLVRRKASPIFRYNDAALLTAVKHRTPKDAVLWNWWGPGYFAQAMAGRKTLIDGGLQEPRRSWIMAVPMATPSPLLARNWIRFFACHGTGELARLARKLGGVKEAAAFLKTVLGDPAALNAELRARCLGDADRWRAHLFPEKVDAYLYLASGMLMRGSWLPIGRWELGSTGMPRALVRSVNTDWIGVDRKAGVITYEGGGSRYSALLMVSPEELSHSPGGRKGDVVIAVPKVNRLFLLEPRHFNAVALRLLFIYPTATPGFEVVEYNPFVGGVWRVH